MELPCPLGIRAMSRKENLSCFNVLSHIINPLLTNLVRSRWLASSRSINTQKKNSANIQPSWPHAWSITHIYYMALWAGKINWLHERTRWRYLTRGLPAVSRGKNFSESHIINPVLTKLVRSRWLDIGLVLLTSTPSRFIKHGKKNFANIQPSLTHAWQ